MVQDRRRFTLNTFRELRTESSEEQVGCDGSARYRTLSINAFNAGVLFKAVCREAAVN